MAEYRVVCEFGTAPNRYQVVDARQWRFGYAVQAEAHDGKGFVDVAGYLKLEDAKLMAKGLAEVERKRRANV